MQNANTELLPPGYSAWLPTEVRRIRKLKQGWQGVGRLSDSKSVNREKPSSLTLEMDKKRIDLP